MTTAALSAARARDSHDKRQRVLDAVQRIEAAGEPITFPAVAKAAQVSIWLVYAEGVREHIEVARKRQAARTDRVADNAEAKSPGLRVDLALARAEINQLRQERDALNHRLRLQLGAEIDGPERSELIARLAELQEVNRRLVAERDASSFEGRANDRRIRELENDLTAARESLRRMIRTENAGH